MADPEKRSSSNADTSQSPNSQTMNQATTTLKNASLNILPRPENRASLDDSKYGSFVYDPNILAPWDPGFGEGDDDEQTQPNPTIAKTETIEEGLSAPPVSDGVPHQEIQAAQEQPATQEPLDAKDSTEMNVGEVKKKSRKSKKSKSKRGLVSSLKVYP